MKNLTILGKSLTLSVLAFISFIAISSIAFAQDTLSIGDALKQWYELYASMETKSGTALGLVVVQGLMLLMKTKLGDYTGKVKLVVVALLSLAVAVLSGLVSGSGIGDILTNGATLSAISVFLHQVFKQFLVKED